MSDIEKLRFRLRKMEAATNDEASAMEEVFTALAERDETIRSLRSELEKEVSSHSSNAPAPSRNGPAVTLAWEPLHRKIYSKQCFTLSAASVFERMPSGAIFFQPTRDDLERLWVILNELQDACKESDAKVAADQPSNLGAGEDVEGER